MVLSYVGTEYRISKAILSRFTLFQMNKYTEEEEDIVLKLEIIIIK